MPTHWAMFPLVQQLRLPWGEKNYNGLKGIEILRSIRNLGTIAKLYYSNKGGFRGYIHQQSLQNFPFLMINEAKKIIPKITLNDIEPSKKVGIRSQLYNSITNKFEDDFICVRMDIKAHI